MLEPHPDRRRPLVADRIAVQPVQPPDADNAELAPLQRTCSKTEGRQRSKGSPQELQVGAVLEPLPDRRGPLVADRER